MRAFLACWAILVFAAAAAAQQGDPLYAVVDGYAAYQVGVTASLAADINSADAMDAALERGARFDPAELARDHLAYLALAAAQSPAFVAGVRARVRAAGRAPVLRQLQRDPTYARRRPPGARDAIALVLAADAADVARLQGAAGRYESIGHAIDGAAWDAPLDPAHRDSRDQSLRALAQTAPLAPELTAHVHAAAGAGDPVHDPDTFGGVRFWDALGGLNLPAPQIAAPRLRPDHTAQMDRVLTLAALFIIGATPSEPARVATELDDPQTTRCLSLQQLQFRQCVSVTHTPDEDAFCLARHGFNGVGECLGAMVQ